MTRNIIILFSSLLTMVACNNYNPTSEYFFLFYPRECSVIFADNAQIRTLDAGTKWEYQDFDTIVNNTVETSNYILQVTTSNVDTVPYVANYNPVKNPRYELLWYLEDKLTSLPNLDLEEQLARSYNKAYKVYSEWTPPPVEMDYRTSEIKSINIYSTTTIFGLAKGSVLNGYFSIIRPAYIFAAPSQMIYGFDDKNRNDISIDKFVSYNPIALPSIYLKFSSIPQEAPIETQFIVELEMADGRILKDTTELVNLLP